MSEFRDTSNIAWYPAAYSLTTCALIPLAGKLSSILPLRWVYQAVDDEHERPGHAVAGADGSPSHGRPPRPRVGDYQVDVVRARARIAPRGEAEAEVGRCVGFGRIAEPTVLHWFGPGGSEQHRMQHQQGQEEKPGPRPSRTRLGDCMADGHGRALEAGLRCRERQPEKERERGTQKRRWAVVGVR
ncbi:uncharacterized protein B0T15DRAFT_526778 [Chaetomium strumarium]|uniref:Uncharacterized protein n=1 Tax=Chaetomium strumarium TaxID=1170767 RepID=A0AAJ0H0I2_9PEZI|nr:hypothetical protein B0T15DRAFT_526778 [Chaetomium strumarium]